MRCRLAVVGLIALLPTGAFVGWLVMPTSPISAANCKRIEDGMSIREVQKMLGREGEDYISGAPYSGQDGFGIVLFQEGRDCIVVYYCSGKVMNATYFHQTIWERIEDWHHGREWISPFGGKAKRLESAA